MRNVLLVFVSLFSLAGAAQNVSPLIQLNTTDVPLIRSDGSCGGTYIGRTLVTAFHCLPDEGGSFSVVDPKRADSSGDVVYQAAQAWKFPQQDLVVLPAIDREPGYKTLTLAAAPPAIGDKVRIEGFPASQADFLDHYPKALDCVVIGPGLGYLPNVDINFVAMAARCPALEELDGFSGGPVVNKFGEMIGVVSDGSKHPKNGFSYVFFSLVRRLPTSPGDAALLMKDGPQHFKTFFLEPAPNDTFDATVTFKNGLLDGPFHMLGSPTPDVEQGQFVKGKLPR